MKRFTKIESNGSKWGGEPPDSIDNLLAVLEQEPLDRSFEAYGNFIEKNPRGAVPGGYKNGKQVYIDTGPIYSGPATNFFGNFFATSHVFNIATNDKAVIAKLTRAIRKNQKRADYLAQPKPKVRPYILKKAA